MMLFEIMALLVVAMLLGLAGATIWSRKNTWVRGAAVLVFIATLPAIAATGFFALSYPSPYQMSIIPEGKYRVRGVKLVQDKAIYLLLDFGQDAPRYFSFPWSNKLADEIQRMMNRQRQRGRSGFAIERDYRGIRVIPIYPMRQNIPKPPPARVPVL